MILCHSVTLSLVTAGPTAGGDRGWWRSAGDRWLLSVIGRHFVSYDDIDRQAGEGVTAIGSQQEEGGSSFLQHYHIDR